MINIGLDNSLSGALCIMSGSQIIAMIPMPVKEYVPPKRGAKTTREIDIVGVWRWINIHVGHQLSDVFVMIEKPTNAKTYRAAGPQNHNGSSYVELGIVDHQGNLRH